MKLVKYEIKKALNLKIVLLSLIFIFICMAFYTYQVESSGKDFDIENIRTLIDVYGYEKTHEKLDELDVEYEKIVQIFNSEKEMQQQFIDGNISREEYAQYTLSLAKAKKMENAWSYIMQRRNSVVDKGGWIIFDNYLEKIIDKLFLQPINIFIVMIVAFSFVLSDNKRGRYDLILCTKKGKYAVYTAKSISTGLVVFVGNIIYYAICFTVFKYKGFFDFYNAPISSIAGELYGEISMKTYIFLGAIICCLIYAAISSFVCMLGCVSRKVQNF